MSTVFYWQVNWASCVHSKWIKTDCHVCHHTLESESSFVALYIGTTVFHGKFFQIPRASLPNSATHRSKFSTYSDWSSTAPEPDQICSICRRQLQLTDTVSLANKLAIFQMSSGQYPDYFMAQSCLHIVINYLRPPETDQNVALFVPLSLASAKFCKIPGKHRNSVETGKFCGSARNSVIRGKLWSLIIHRGLWAVSACSSVITSNWSNSFIDCCICIL